MRRDQVPNLFTSQRSAKTTEKKVRSTTIVLHLPPGVSYYTHQKKTTIKPTATLARSTTKYQVFKHPTECRSNVPRYVLFSSVYLW
jgi:hypothetical protein